MCGSPPGLSQAGSQCLAAEPQKHRPVQTLARARAPATSHLSPWHPAQCGSVISADTAVQCAALRARYWSPCSGYIPVRHVPCSFHGSHGQWHALTLLFRGNGSDKRAGCLGLSLPASLVAGCEPAVHSTRSACSSCGSHWPHGLDWRLKHQLKLVFQRNSLCVAPTTIRRKDRTSAAPSGAPSHKQTEALSTAGLVGPEESSLKRRRQEVNEGGTWRLPSGILRYTMRGELSGTPSGGALPTRSMDATCTSTCVAAWASCTNTSSHVVYQPRSRAQNEVS